jgi:predicted TPR repeat methyltransferase
MSCAPYVPSPPDVITKMLEVANVGPDDVVYDLGCGDGRVLFTAVQEFKAKKAVGYELNENRYDNIVKEIERQNLQEKIHVFNKNLFEADLSEATVITLYLTTYANNNLKPKLAEETHQGTRIVSHDFGVDDWQFSKKEHLSNHAIYLYTVPESFITKKKSTKKDSFLNRFFRLIQ